MKKEPIPLSLADQESLLAQNKIWISVSWPLLRMYCTGVGIAFAVLMVATYLLGWRDGLGLVILLIVGVFAYFILRLLWPNIQRNLDIAWGKKYRLEIPDYEVHPNEDGYTATFNGWPEPLLISEPFPNGQPPQGPLMVEYAPISKTVFLVALKSLS